MIMSMSIYVTVSLKVCHEYLFQEELQLSLQVSIAAASTDPVTADSRLQPLSPVTGFVVNTPALNPSYNKNKSKLNRLLLLHGPTNFLS
jgi:hypothetical protein